jgi:hypothetical protein
MRHGKLKPGAEADEAALRALIEAAYGMRGIELAERSTELGTAAFSPLTLFVSDGSTASNGRIGKGKYFRFWTY